MLGALAFAYGCLNLTNLLFAGEKPYRGILESMFGIPGGMHVPAFIIAVIFAGIVYLFYISSPAAWLGHLGLFFDKPSREQ